MALHLGNERVKVISNGVLYSLYLSPSIETTNSRVLLSFDGYILTDSHGVILISNELKSSIINDNVALSSEGYILKDSNEKYLIIKESE